MVDPESPHFDKHNFTKQTVEVSGCHLDSLQDLWAVFILCKGPGSLLLLVDLTCCAATDLDFSCSSTLLAWNCTRAGRVYNSSSLSLPRALRPQRRMWGVR